MRLAALFCVGLWIGLTAFAGPASAKRVALVIGNDDYENISKLEKAVNDSHAMKVALESVGFEVIHAENVSRDQMYNQIDAFVSKLEAVDEALFFFAGQGVAIEGENVLLPVDVPVVTQQRIARSKVVGVEEILNRMHRKGVRASILILDACQNDPFPKDGDSAPAEIASPVRFDPGQNAFVLYSAGVNEEALERLPGDANPNSVFTRSLVPLLSKSSLSLSQIARAVQAEVTALANSVSKKQTPVYYDGLTPDFYFSGGPEIADKEAEPKPEPKAAGGFLDRLSAEERAQFERDRAEQEGAEGQASSQWKRHHYDHPLWRLPWLLRPTAAKQAKEHEDKGDLVSAAILYRLAAPDFPDYAREDFLVLADELDDRARRQFEAKHGSTQIEKDRAELAGLRERLAALEQQKAQPVAPAPRRSSPD